MRNALKFDPGARVRSRKPIPPAAVPVASEELLFDFTNGLTHRVLVERFAGPGAARMTAGKDQHLSRDTDGTVTLYTSLGLVPTASTRDGAEESRPSLRLH